MILLLSLACVFERTIYDGDVVAADLWADEPLILSAGLGFDNIIGLPEITEALVVEAGGSWYGSLACASGEAPTDAMRTSAAAADGVNRGYIGEVDYDDGLPVVFSWPVDGRTLSPEDFQVTLNTGARVTPDAAGLFPNWEPNERNTVVLFGDFGNRGRSGEPDAEFPVRMDIVDDGRPLMLYGPGGEAVSAVGLSWETDASPYDAGPRLVGAKLNFVDEEPRGEPEGVRTRAMGTVPNHERALYDEGDFRLRVLTTGGFSPDGVTGLRPGMYEDFFVIHALGPEGETVRLEEVGVDYAVAGGTLRVVGLADLGLPIDPEAGVFDDDCYVEDRDNQIDVILVGDEAAARSVTFIEIPALEGGKRAFYNPGGPGPEPTEGVRYTAPGPPDLEPVILALDDPMRVTAP